MGRIASFYGFSEDNERILRIAKIIVGFVPILVAFTSMSTTFYMIFVADQLSNYVLKAVHICELVELT